MVQKLVIQLFIISIVKFKFKMPKRSAIALFVAATSALSIAATEDISLKAGENDMGGLKEQNTDMPVNSDFILDDAAQKLADEAAKSSTCVPIGEGENCW